MTPFAFTAPPLLLAAFGTPLMLWGLAGASLPILIHLLNRRKYRETTWAAMTFLLAAIRKNQKRIRIEQWLLLAIRTLLIALLAMAMARPALEQLSNLGIFAGRRHWVLAVDSSMSMETRQGEVSRFEQARDAARRVVNEARAGDGFSLIALTDPPRVVIGPPSFVKEAVLRAIDALPPTHGTLDPVVGLRVIDETLAASDLRRKEVVVVSDMQRASWETTTTGAGERLRALTSRLAAKSPRTLFIDVGVGEEPNRAVVDLATRPAFVTPGTPVELRARVGAFGAAFPAGRARLVVDGRLIPDEEQQVPALEPGATAELSFRYVFDTPSDTSVEVRIDDDALRVDNHRAEVVSVREAMQVLLVDGDPRPGIFESDTAFLAEALSPAVDSPGQQAGPIAVQIVTEATLPRLDLSEYQVVVLCNIARITRDVVGALEAFLAQGGGVVFFVGDQVQADNYNRMLYDGGQGLLPAQIGMPAGDPDKRENPYTLDTRDLSHPIVADFQGQADPVLASLTNVKTYRYLRLTLPADNGARVALGIGGDPLIVEGRRGRGRVLLVATTADRDWTDWPIHQSYPAVMEKLVLEAATGKLTERTVRVGEPLEAVFPASAAGTEAVITAPAADESAGDASAETSRVGLESDQSITRLRTPATELSGGYRVDLGPPLSRQLRFAANPDPEESEVDRLDRAGLEAALPGLEFDFATGRVATASTARSATSSASLGDLHRPLLWSVLGLLLLESMLAWWFGNRAGLSRGGE